MDSDLVGAGDRADMLAALLKAQPTHLDVLVSAEEEAAAVLVAAGVDLRNLVPATDEVGLGFSGGGRPHGRSIFRAYRDALREDLCDPEADLHQRVSAGTNMGGAALVGVLLAALGLPVLAGALLAPVAGAILGVGLKTYCRAVSTV